MPQLDNHEIQRIYGMLKEFLETKSSEEVLATIRSFVRRYYSCYPFVLQMGLFLMNHADLLPGEEKIFTYTKEAQELFIHVRTQAKDPELITQALKYEAYASLVLQEYDQVLALLGERVPAAFPIEILIAAAQQQKGEPQQAIATLQSGIYQNIAVFMSFLTNYLQIVGNDRKKFSDTVTRGSEFAEIFNFQELHPVVLMNFQLSAIFGYAQMGEEEATLQILKQFMVVLKNTKFPVKLHGDDYFDQVDAWLEQSELGDQLPRDSMQVRSSLIDLILNNPLFEKFEKQEQFAQIFAELQLLKEQEVTENA